MSITSRLRSGKKSEAKKAPVKKAGKAPARKVTGKAPARKVTGKPKTARKQRTPAQIKARRDWQRNYMRMYRAKLHASGWYLDKHGHAEKMSPEQKRRMAARRGKHGKNWNKKMSSGKIAAVKRGEKKSALVKRRKARHGKRLPSSVSGRAGVSVKGTKRR
jgi:hypothetical protein